MQTIVTIAGWIAGIAAALAAIQKWMIEPLKKWMEKTVTEKLTGMEASMKTVQDDVADLLGDRLRDAYQKAMREGFCSHEDKRRYVELHKRYTARGHNHLAERYEQDLLELPEGNAR